MSLTKVQVRDVFNVWLTFVLKFHVIIWSSVSQPFYITAHILQIFGDFWCWNGLKVQLGINLQYGSVPRNHCLEPLYESEGIAELYCFPFLCVRLCQMPSDKKDFEHFIHCNKMMIKLTPSLCYANVGAINVIFMQNNYFASPREAYSEFQGFRSLLASQLFSSWFWPLLTRASFFEAAKAVAKIGLSLKSNHHWQI